MSACHLAELAHAAFWAVVVFDFLGTDRTESALAVEADHRFSLERLCAFVAVLSEHVRHLSPTLSKTV
jgi:hypothetical protein